MFKLLNKFNRTVDYWLSELNHYYFNELCDKPTPQDWSLGQVYMHLISNVYFYIEEIQICLSSNDHADEEASPEGKKMFLDNSFPDVFIEGPPENADTPQPESKEHLVDLLKQAKQKLNEAASDISLNSFQGKTKHPGLHYFSAHEWLQFADMHFRHHLRQKKRIDAFLSEKYRFTK